MSPGPLIGNFAHFVAANTILKAPPHVPEIRLHLAEESLPIWQKTEEELGEINVPPPFWAFAWAGGQALARYLLDTPNEVTGKTVLDLGTGSGLTAIAAMQAGAISVLAADIDRMALASARLNAAANDVAIATTRRTSCWICPLLRSRPRRRLVLRTRTRRARPRLYCGCTRERCARPRRRSAAELLSQKSICLGSPIRSAGDPRAGRRFGKENGCLGAQAKRLTRPPYTAAQNATFWFVPSISCAPPSVLP